MPINKKESLIFTILMCFFMVYFMSIYNIGLHTGFGLETFQTAWMGLPIAFVVGIVLDCFVVSKVAKGIAFKIISKDSSNTAKIVTISSCMVIGMVIFMSLFGAIQQNGIQTTTLFAWARNIPMNFVVALPLQLLIAGPIVRKVFRSTFPIGSIQ